MQNKKTNWRAAAFMAACVLTGWTSGCTSPSGDATRHLSADGKPSLRAECLVCKMNADLACVDVDVDAKTPSYLYQGKTYYFCSDECRDKFAKNPQKFAPK